MIEPITFRALPYPLPAVVRQQLIDASLLPKAADRLAAIDHITDLARAVLGVTVTRLPFWTEGGEQ